MKISLRSVISALVALLALAACGSTPSTLEIRTLTVGSRVTYGDAPSQYGLLNVPDGPGPHPVVVLIHGGFWRASNGMELMHPLTDDLLDQGYAVWNIEYRRVGEPGGGYPGTMLDVANAIDLLEVLAADNRLDLARVATIGHSAGGHLALWAGGRTTLDSGDPGADPTVVPVVSVGQAAVVDLYAAAADDLGRSAVEGLLGGEPADVPDAYAVAQPDLSVGRPVLVHGADDGIVPPEQSTAHAELVEVMFIDGENHFDMIDPDSAAWAAVLDRLSESLGA